MLVALCRENGEGAELKMRAGEYGEGMWALGCIKLRVISVCRSVHEH